MTREELVTARDSARDLAVTEARRILGTFESMAEYAEAVANYKKADLDLFIYDVEY